jgi:hypothetical protein
MVCIFRGGHRGSRAYVASPGAASSLVEFSKKFRLAGIILRLQASIRHMIHAYTTLPHSAPAHLRTPAHVTESDRMLRFRMHFRERPEGGETQRHNVERFGSCVLPATRTPCNQMQRSAIFEKLSRPYFAPPSPAPPGTPSAGCRPDRWRFQLSPREQFSMGRTVAHDNP